MPDPRSMTADDLVADLRWLRGFARRLVQDAGDAEDVVQDAWLRAIERAPRDLDRERFRAWLSRVTRHLVSHRWRDEAVRRDHEGRAPAAGEVREPARDLMHLQLLHRLAGAVLDLDEPYRSAVVLRYQKELSYPEIARRLDAAEATIRKRVSRGLEQLRERLEREHEGPGDWRRALLGAAHDSRPAPTAVFARPLPLALAAGAVIVVATTLLRLDAGSTVPASTSWWGAAAVDPGASAGAQERAALEHLSSWLGRWDPPPGQPGESFEFSWGLPGKTVRLREFPSGSTEPSAEALIGWHPGQKQLVFQSFRAEQPTFESMLSGCAWFEEDGSLCREFQAIEPDDQTLLYRDRLGPVTDARCTWTIEVESAGHWQVLDRQEVRRR